MKIESASPPAPAERSDPGNVRSWSVALVVVSLATLPMLVIIPPVAPFLAVVCLVTALVALRRYPGHRVMLRSAASASGLTLVITVALAVLLLPARTTVTSSTTVDSVQAGTPGGESTP